MINGNLIIQSVAFDDFDSLTVIPMTTIEVNSDFRVKIEPSEENNFSVRCLQDK